MIKYINYIFLIFQHKKCFNLFVFILQFSYIFYRYFFLFCSCFTIFIYYIFFYICTYIYFLLFLSHNFNLSLNVNEFFSLGVSVTRVRLLPARSLLKTSRFQVLFTTVWSRHKWSYFLNNSTSIVWLSHIFKCSPNTLMLFFTLLC